MEGYINYLVKSWLYSLLIFTVANYSLPLMADCAVCLWRKKILYYYFHILTEKKRMPADKGVYAVWLFVRLKRILPVTYLKQITLREAIITASKAFLLYFYYWDSVKELINNVFKW